MTQEGLDQALTAIAQSGDRAVRAWITASESFAVTCDATASALKKFAAQSERMRAEFEATLSARETTLYMKLMDERDNCWLDCAVIIERLRRASVREPTL